MIVAPQSVKQKSIKKKLSVTEGGENAFKSLKTTARTSLTATTKDNKEKQDKKPRKTTPLRNRKFNKALISGKDNEVGATDPESEQPIK